MLFKLVPQLVAFHMSHYIRVTQLCQMCWKATIFPISRYIYYFSQTQQKYKCRSLQFILLQLQLLECVLQTYYIESWTDYIILLCSWAQASTAEYGSQVAKEHWPNSQVQNWHKPFKHSPKIHTTRAERTQKMHQTPKWPVKICTDLKSPQCYTSAPQQAKFAPRYTTSAPH